MLESQQGALGSSTDCSTQTCGRLCYFPHPRPRLNDPQLSATRAQLQRLAAIGLSAGDLPFFRHHFVGHPFEYITRSGDGDWQLIRNRPLSNACLVRHLEQRDYWVGTGCRWDSDRKRFVTDYLILDLDAGDDLLARYDTVRSVLALPSLLFRSSRSGGLHAYWFLSAAVELHELRTMHGQGGAVMRLLAASGLHEADGRMEVYPRGHYRQYGVQNRVRLPFGSGSRLLDPHTLQPLTGGRPGEDLRLVRSMFEVGQLCRLDVRELRQRAAGCPAVRTRSAPSTQQLARAPSAGVCPVSDSDGCWHDGLTGPGQLNTATASLAFQMRRDGVPEEAASDRIVAWLHERHGGHSRTYNASPARAVAQVRAEVHRIYARSWQRRVWSDLPGLSPFEIRSLLAVLEGDHARVDPATGVMLSRFKLERFGFELLRRAKQYVLTMATPPAQTLLAAYPDYGFPPSETARGLDDMRSIWPDPTRGDFVVPVPYALRVSLDGVSEMVQGPLWRALLHAGLFRPHVPSWAEAHRAATFMVTLDFGAWSDVLDRFQSFERGVSWRLEDSDIRRRYSRHHVRRILRAPREVSLVSRPSVEDVIAVLHWSALREPHLERRAA